MLNYTKTQMINSAERTRPMTQTTKSRKRPRCLFMGILLSLYCIGMTVPAYASQNIVNDQSNPSFTFTCQITDNPTIFEVNDEWSQLSLEVVRSRQAEEYTKAIEQAKKLIEIAKEVKGERHIATVLSYEALGLSYLGIRDYDKSNDAFLTANRIITEMSNNPKYESYKEELKTFISFEAYYIGANYFMLKDFDKSMQYANISLENRNIANTNPYDLSDLYELFSNLYKQQQNITKFIEVQEKLVALNENRIGKQDAKMLYWINELTDAYIANKQPEQAIELQQRIIKVYESQNLADNQEIAIAYMTLGKLHSELGQHQKAIEYYLKLHSISSSLYGDTHINIIPSYMALGTEYLAVNEFDKSKSNFDKVQSLLDNTEINRKLTTEQINFVKKKLAENLSKLP